MNPSTAVIIKYLLLTVKGITSLNLYCHSFLVQRAWKKNCTKVKDVDGLTVNISNKSKRNAWLCFGADQTVKPVFVHELNSVRELLLSSCMSYRPEVWTSFTPQYSLTGVSVGVPTPSHANWTWTPAWAVLTENMSRYNKHTEEEGVTLVGNKKNVHNFNWI